MRKKVKRKLTILCLVGGVLLGGITAAASSYVESNMPGYPSISCWGSIGYTNYTITATTNCNHSTDIFYRTSVTGQFKIGENQTSTVMSASGESKAAISYPNAIGYTYGNGTHKVYYRDKVWSQSTSL